MAEMDMESEMDISSDIKSHLNMKIDVDINEIKTKIEHMNKHHQIEILRILKSDKNIVLNENNNGVFVNISYLDNNTLDRLLKYIDYVENQMSNIETVENKKILIETTFFKGNKENNYI